MRLRRMLPVSRFPMRRILHIVLTIWRTVRRRFRKQTKDFSWGVGDAAEHLGFRDGRAACERCAGEVL